MTGDRRTRVLVGLLVTSVVAGAFVGLASAGDGNGAAFADPAADDVESIEALNSVQSGENETSARENTTVDHDGEHVTLAPSAGETISGQTDLEAGQTVTIQVESADPQSPFIRSVDATVADDGSFSGTVDLSNLAEETAVEVHIRDDDGTLARVDGVVTRCTENCSDPAEWPEFDRAVVTAEPGTATDVTVDVPTEADGPVHLTLGDEDASFRVETTVSDADGDGQVVLTLDTSVAGNGAPSEYLSAGDDAIESAEQSSQVLDAPLEAGNYELELGPSDAPYDVGTLVLVESESDADDGEDGADGSNDAELAVDTTGEVTFITAGDTLEVGTVEHQRIHAETELEPGTTVHVQLSSTDASNPFFYTPTANVTDYGTFNVTVDLRDVSPGSTFELVAYADDEARGATVGRVVECDDGCPQFSGDANQSAGASNASEAPDDESNVVEVDDDDGGSIPSEGLAAIGIGGLLSLLGVAHFTGVLER